MNKTNSKAVKEAVKNYILECIDGDDANTMEALKERFYSEYGFMVPRVGEVNACVEWLRGLAIGCDYYYCDIAERLSNWLDDTVENQEKWIDKKGDGLYWLLMAREITK